DTGSLSLPTRLSSYLLLRHDVRELAEFQAGAADDVASEGRRLRGQPLLLQLGGKLVCILRGQVQEEQLFIGGRAQPRGSIRLGKLRQALQLGAIGVTDRGLHAQVDLAVPLLVDADVVAVAGVLARVRTVDELAAEVILLQHLAELLDAPVGNKELQARAVANLAVSVVAEDADYAGPHLRDLIQGHPGTEPLGKHRVGRQPAADPNVEARTVLRVIRTNKRQVLDLVGDILAGIAATRGLELASQVIELATGEQLPLASADGRGGVDNLVGGDTGDWGAQDDAGNVAATEVGVQPNGFELVPDSRDILDADPVQLDVLAVGEVRGVAGVVARNLA